MFTYHHTHIHCVSKQVVHPSQQLSILSRFSKILSLLEREVKFQQNPYNISHHAFSMLLHYLVKVRNTNLWYFPKNLSKNHVTFDKNWNVSCRMAEYCHNSCLKCPPLPAHRREDVHATCQLHCQWWSGQCHAKHAANAASVHNKLTAIYKGYLTGTGIEPTSK